MRKTGEFLTRFWREENGAAAAEYVLILAIVGAGLALAAEELGSTISTALTDMASCIEDSTTCNL